MESVLAELPHHTFELDNGLRVAVHEDPSSPVACVNLWYRVGSKDETRGRTGFAHLFEHLMFEGSKHVPPGRFDAWLEDAGGTNNGSTTPDRTNYWITVPSSAFELALFLEADRMGWLTLSAETFEAQRDVVINERRQSYENRPYGLAYERLLAALYPETHPYSWPTIGFTADLEAASLEQARAFHRAYYSPSNALLAVAGNFDGARVEDLVQRQFGGIPAGGVAPSAADVPDAKLAEDIFVALEDDVTLPRVYLAWHTPAMFAPGDASLDLAANVLAGGKASRLYASLVRERGIAQDVEAYQESGLLGSLFLVIATARADVSADTLAGELRAELERLASDGPDAREVERARNGLLADFIGDLETAGGFDGRADRLNHYAFYAGDAGYLPHDLARYEAEDRSTIRDVVASVIASPGVSLHVLPRGGNGE